MAQRHAEYYDRVGDELRSMKAGEDATFSPQVFNLLIDYCPEHFNTLEPLMRGLGIDSFTQLQEYSLERLSRELCSRGCSERSFSALIRALDGYNADEKNRDKAKLTLYTPPSPELNGEEQPNASCYCFEGWRRILRLKTYEIKPKPDDPHTIEVNGVELTGNKETARLAQGGRKRAKLTATELQTLFTTYRTGRDPSLIATDLHISEGCVRSYLRAVGVIPPREHAVAIHKYLREADSNA